MGNKITVLDHESVKRKLERIAHQLHEENFEEKGIVLIGVADRGSILVKRLAKRLKEISELEITIAEIKLDKDKPLENPVELSVDAKELKGKVVVLVDDVLMSGRTLMYAASFLIRSALKKLVTVVLVDRMHRTFPIRADIVGLTLSTTLREHISVELGKQDAVYLA
ncbi:MAG: phosphoribosyltransferase [Bacteroidota bacterium]|nr:phosphoribosyltransferase [Bacteroidota bacterium]